MLFAGRTFSQSRFARRRGHLGSNKLPCSGQQLPCFLPQNSLFDSVGKLREGRCGTEISRAMRMPRRPWFREFPCIFPC